MPHSAIDRVRPLGLLWRTPVR